MCHHPGGRAFGWHSDGLVCQYETASGCVLLPGLPHLGLDHRAAWVEADVHGTVTQMISKSGVDPFQNPDTAALATFLAA
ncbi:MAG: hypothetical protein WKF57_10765 [Nakamurella sp.]